jgi:predicted nucleic acid-binding protein
VVVAELIFVTRRVIGWSRTEAAERIGAFLSADGIRVREKTIVERALSLLAARRIDFADAYLAALAQASAPSAIASFDRDLDDIPGVRRIAR